MTSHWRRRDEIGDKTVVIIAKQAKGTGWRQNKQFQSATKAWSKLFRYPGMKGFVFFMITIWETRGSFDFDIKQAKKVGSDFRNDLCNGMI